MTPSARKSWPPWKRCLAGTLRTDDLKSELTGKFQKLMVALMKPWLWDARELGPRAGADGPECLQDLGGGRQLRPEEDVVGVQGVLVVLLRAHRDPDAGPEESQVEQDARVLFQAGELQPRRVEKSLAAP